MGERTPWIWSRTRKKADAGVVVGRELKVMAMW